MRSDICKPICFKLDIMIDSIKRNSSVASLNKSRTFKVRVERDGKFYCTHFVGDFLINLDEI